MFAGFNIVKVAHHVLLNTMDFPFFHQVGKVYIISPAMIPYQLQFIIDLI